MLVARRTDAAYMHLLGWQADQRDSKTGAPVENKDKFPNGMKDVADKIHAMGMKVQYDDFAQWRSLFIHKESFAVWYLQ